MKSLAAIAEIPGELRILVELVASARRLMSAKFGIALLVVADGTPTALSHQGMTSTEVGAPPARTGRAGRGRTGR